MNKPAQAAQMASTEKTAQSAHRAQPTQTAHPMQPTQAAQPPLTSITLLAPAKLNLLLGVSPHVVAGKHQLTTVFTTINLADTLTFTFDPAPARDRRVVIEVNCAEGIPPLDLPIERNIVYQAVLALEQACGRKLNGQLHVAIDKHIPPQGGLAGGSTDAAATLRALAGLWDIDPLSEPVLSAAKILGADVAFFLYGGCALMGGAGEKLLRRLPTPALDLVLVKPAGGVATSAAYAAFDAHPQPLPAVDRLLELLQGAEVTGAPDVSPQELAQEFANNLRPAACALMPELEGLIVEVAARRGVCAALLTGSGSTVFGVCENAAAAREVATRFAREGYWAQACATMAPATTAPATTATV